MDMMIMDIATLSQVGKKKKNAFWTTKRTLFC